MNDLVVAVLNLNNPNLTFEHFVSTLKSHQISKAFSQFFYFFLFFKNDKANHPLRKK